MKTIKILSLTMFIVLLTACSKISEGDADHDKLQIVATYSIIADMTENIVGEKAEVYSMVPIGTDPHMYDPLPKDTSKVSSADLVFYNGLNLETGKGWFQDLLDVTNKKDVAFAVSDEVSPMYLTEKGKETQVDPHAWLDIQNSIKYVDIITKRVIEKDPDNKEFYLNNQSEYVKKLNELDQYAKEAVEKFHKRNVSLLPAKEHSNIFLKLTDLNQLLSGRSIRIVKERLNK